MYDFVNIEKKWQDKWNDLKIGEVDLDSKPKYFLIWAYLTVSGFHHVGHMRGFSYADAICRYKRMQGFNVLMPAGGHATGNGAFSKSQKIASKDKDTIEYYKSMGLNDLDLEKISTAEGFIDYFTKSYIKDYKSYGFIGDWRRYTVTTTKDYNKFIEWQFKKLKEKDLLIQKPYYATACIKCGPVAVDPSEMDLSKGGNAQKNEYTILKLKLEENTYVVVATLRPETVYGQTNVWLDYNIDYVKVKVGNETWVASKEFAEKLKYQKENIKILTTISGKELIGKYVEAPAVNRQIIILPSKFCDPKIGTGIVTSVPSDAPSDWIGLFDLQRSEKLCKQYNLDFNKIKEIKPIPIINSKGYGKFPAVEICEKLKINSQDDTQKLEEAKKEIYKKGFHTGVMLENCGKYAGMKVEQAKDEMKKDLIDQKLADIFYDLSEEVICRCGNQVVIKKIDNQWFIKYSDENLTKKTIEHTESMLLLPEQYKNNLPNILNWFDDRACARQGRWLGTKLPFDETYTIEPIADSTLYPIFYLVSLYTNSGQIKEEQLTEEFFDYVYLGKGSSEDVSSKTGLDKELVEKVKKDVEYWYKDGLDINLGGQEHQTVHFPVFLMNHVGILPENYWPNGIIVNWWVINKSGKISKSKGGVRSIGDEAKTYSVDAIRLFYANVASPFVNIDFPPEDLKKYKQRLEKIYYFIESLVEEGKLEEKEQNNLDSWLESKFNIRLKNIISSMDRIELKEATDDIYFNIYNDIHWYLRRGGNNKSVVLPILNKWMKTSGMFTPHLAEETNVLLGNSELIATSKFPEVDESKINDKLDEEEKITEKVLFDIRKVIELSKINVITKVTLFISEKYKWKYYGDLQKYWTKNGSNVGLIIGDMQYEYPNIEKQKISKDVINYIKKDHRYINVTDTQDYEFNRIKNILDFISGELNVSVDVLKGDDSDHPKAKNTYPGNIGILVE